ncbi:MAG: hypothetical protein HY355_03275 [Armatimonadetes bacterium]|nr:hypothetical protein [Armatimonadota bacterium]
MRRHRGSLISLDDVLVGARLLLRLPVFLRTPVTPERAREVLRRRLERREADFLTLVHHAVYQNPGSPFRQLLELAGCEYRDLEKLVTQEGIEGALRILCRNGVYLTVDEFKGRRPTVRGSTTLTVSPDRLRNPRASVHVTAQTSGSRGAVTAVGIDLANMRDEAVDLGLYLDARGGTRWVHALWSVPGSSAVRLLLRMSGCGAEVARWFSQVDPAAPDLHFRYRWSARLVRWGSLLAGAAVPSPQYVPLETPLPIARWMAEVARRGDVPHLTTFSSAAVRLCLVALEAGIDFRGVQFTLGGEPTTAARLALIRRTGAVAVPRYSSIEVGQIGYGCLAPEAPDDVHVLADLHAVIQAEVDAGSASLPPQALLITSLRPTAPLVLLNVSLGDQATMVRRACGCPVERLGWTTHLHTIRSYEKLTAGGMTFLDRDVIRVLEEVLPARFGGAPTDYQLLEEETSEGRPLLRLLVHPSVGPLDSDAVANAFLAAVGTGSGAERIMELLWRDATVLRVERLVPYVTASGKILHLHLHRKGSHPSSRAPARGAAGYRDTML